MTRAAGTETLLEEAERLEVEASARSWAPYPEYRATGLDWLERVPAHWRLQKLKHAARIQFSNVDKKSEDGEQPVHLCNYVDVYYHDLITSDIEFMEATALPREVAKFQLMTGDVLVTKDSEDPHDICVPAVVAEDLPGVLCGYHLAQIRPARDDAFGPYLSYALASSGIRDQFRMRANGITRFGLSQDDICSSIVCLPPLPEQRAIAAFLDRKTRQIDELIEKKRRLIELLQEKRTALISHAVTKGLNPDAPMKPSGIDWLGDVPEHWEVKQLKYAATFQRGHDLPLDARAPGEVPIVTSAGESAWHDTAIAPGPAIVTGRYGTIGDFHLVKRPFWPLNTTLYTVDLRGNRATYLWYMLHLLKPVFLSEAAKSAVPGVDRNDLHPVPVAVAPANEQSSIEAYLDAAVRNIASVIHTTEQVADVLVEYRQALVSAAVTGAIDVRDHPATEHTAPRITPSPRSSTSSFD